MSLVILTHQANLFKLFFKVIINTFMPLPLDPHSILYLCLISNLRLILNLYPMLLHQYFGFNQEFYKFYSQKTCIVYEKTKHLLFYGYWCYRSTIIEGNTIIRITCAIIESYWQSHNLLRENGEIKAAGHNKV